MLVEERSVAESSTPEYVFLLADLGEPWEQPRRLNTRTAFGYVRDYPVWLDNSSVAFGVSEEPSREDSYRVLRWKAPFTAPAKEAPELARYFRQRTEGEIERTRAALRLIPQGLVPQDIHESIGQGHGLILSPDGTSVTVLTFELLIKSYVCLSPSGTKIALANQGKTLTLLDLDAKTQHSVTPLTLFPNERTLLCDIRWSPDEQWVLFTESHYRRFTALGVMKGNTWAEALALVRAANVKSGEAFTLTLGWDGLWIDPYDALYSGMCFDPPSGN